MFGVRIRHLCAAAVLLVAAMILPAADSAPSTSTRLGVRSGSFTVNGQATFLLGFSYYGALGARQDMVRQNLEQAQRLGFNWLRVWATWNAFDRDISAVATNGMAREPFLGKFDWLVFSQWPAGACGRQTAGAQFRPEPAAALRPTRCRGTASGATGGGPS